MDYREMREAVVTIMTYIDTHQVEKLSTIFADDVKYHLLGSPVMEGISAVEDYYSRRRRIRDGKHELRDFTAAENRSATRGVFRGVLKTGEPVEFGFCDFHIFEDGKVKEVYVYTDQGTIGPRE
jgi:uncharacterized protein